MSTTKMGYEGILYYGTAGSTASTQVTNCVDLQYDIDAEYGDTTVRGDGSLVPIESGRPTLRKASITWKMLMKSDDTTLTALRAAAAVQSVIALRTKSFASGTGFDGDCFISCKQGMPLKGEQTLEFALMKVSETDGRAALLSA